MDSLSFKRFTNDAISTSQREVVTAPLWSGEQSKLSTVFTSSAQSDNEKRYYYEIFNSQSNAVGAESQFSITYGDIAASGSSTGSFGFDTLDYPTKAIYAQYRQLLLTNQNLFKFQNDETSEYIYVVNVNRSRFKDRMDTNTWQLNLMHINGTGSALLGQVVVSSSNKVVSLIDDSGQSTTESATLGGRVFNVRSGSLVNGIYTADTTPWGLFYPDYGIIVLNGKALDTSASFSTARTTAGSGSEFGGGANNTFRLWTSISGAMSYDSTNLAFQGATSEVISSTYYYARLLNNEFNYTGNPSFYSGSRNELKWPGMYNDPRVYLTTVGLYDDNYQLLAVAKLNEAVAKTFDKEVVIKVKLDY
jgi:hypothetical protein